jgi:hypothetical protein
MASRACGLRGIVGVVALTGMALAGAATAQAQQRGTQPAGAPPSSVQLSPAQLETLMTPLSGVPQQMLPAVLDACRYPADIMDAQQSLARPQAEIKTTWNTGVQFLARYAPDLLNILSRDIGATAQLGEAYARQPNDVLRAYGAVELRTRQPVRPAASAAAPAPTARPMQLGPARPATPAPTNVTASPATQACETRGNPLRGMAHGAGRGALIGEISGNPGRGAAVGGARTGFAVALRRAAERREAQARCT